MSVTSFSECIAFLAWAKPLVSRHLLRIILRNGTTINLYHFALSQSCSELASPNWMLL